MRLHRLALVVIVAALPSVAAAQSKAPPPALDEVKPVGEYSGVIGEDSGARVAVGKPGKHPRILWTGFRAREGGGARLFLQLDREVAVKQMVAPTGHLVIDLGDTRAATTNSWRWLDTRFFDSTVAKIEMRRQGRGRHDQRFIVSVTFKEKGDAAEASASTVTGKDGLTYLYFDFPAARQP